MASIQELIVALQNIKTQSEELFNKAAASGNTLSMQVTNIVVVTKPSNSGQQAANAVGVAAQSLKNAAASMKSLGRICDDYINSAQR